jgi:hypothetical protein
MSLKDHLGSYAVIFWKPEEMEIILIDYTLTTLKTTQLSTVI